MDVVAATVGRQRRQAGMAYRPQAKRVDPDVFARRNRRQRMLEAVARVFSPLL